MNNPSVPVIVLPGTDRQQSVPIIFLPGTDICISAGDPCRFSFRRRFETVLWRETQSATAINIIGRRTEGSSWIKLLEDEPKGQHLISTSIYTDFPPVTLLILAFRFFFLRSEPPSLFLSSLFCFQSTSYHGALVIRWKIHHGL